MTATPQGDFWIGSNGNAYVKASGIPGGVIDVGSPSNVSSAGFENPVSHQSVQMPLQQIQDPNPGGGSSSSTSNNNSVNSSSNNSNSMYGNLNAPEYLQGIQQEYEATINGAPSMANIYNQQMGAEQAGYEHSRDAAIANAQQQNSANQANLQSQINSTKSGQQLSLQELANQIRSMYGGLGAQLGAAGAGSSSAAKMGAQGIAQTQNTQRADIEQQAGANISNLETQQAGQNATTQKLIEGYQQTAADQVRTLQTNYAQLMQQLNEAVQQASGEEKARLAMFGQVATDTANQTLQNIEHQTTAQINQLLGNNVQPLTEGQLQAVTPVNPVQMPNISANSPVSPAGGNATSTGAPGNYLALLRNEQNQG